jgi:thiol-disulfide isomerase/thioredoxin
MREDQGEGLREPAGQEIVVQSVEAIDERRLRALVRERKGRILLLNIWATWCVPCVEEFPDLVKLSKLYDPKRVEVVGISADFPDEVSSKILPFLRRQKVPFKNYVADFKDQGDFINAVNRSWSGALPATFIYDLNGRERFSLVGKGTFEQFKREIDKVRGVK